MCALRLRCAGALNRINAAETKPPFHVSDPPVRFLLILVIFLYERFDMSFLAYIPCVHLKQAIVKD